MQAKNTNIQYQKKKLIGENGSEGLKHVTMVGVYGVVKKDGKMLLVRQQKGPYAGKLDFPGGGIEFASLQSKHCIGNLWKKSQWSLILCN